MPAPPADVMARRRYLNKPTRLTATNSESTSCAALVSGAYLVYGTADFYFRQGAVASVTAASDCWLVSAGDILTMYVSGDTEDASVAARAVSDTSTVYVGFLS